MDKTTLVKLLSSSYFKQVFYFLVRLHYYLKPFQLPNIMITLQCWILTFC